MNKDPNTPEHGEGHSARYWQIRISLELIKLVIWTSLQVAREIIRGI